MAEKPEHHRYTPSATDQKIIGELIASPHQNNVELAKKLGMSSRTVGNRIRALIDGNVLRIIARQDIQLMGYKNLSTATIYKPTTALVKALKKQPYVLTIASALTENCLLLATCHNTLTELCDDLNDLVARHSPKSYCEINECIRPLKYDLNAASFRSEPSSPQLEKHYQFSFEALCDNTDFEIVRRLKKNARQSNRSIGRDLNLSENAVRKRIASLVDKQLLKIGAVFNSEKLFLKHSVYIGELSVPPAQLDTALNYLQISRDVLILMQTNGSTNVYFSAIYDQPESIQALAQQLEAFGEIKTLRPVNRNPVLFRPEFMVVV